MIRCTSLVRELQRRFRETGEIDTVFVDLEAAMDPADAIAEIGIQSKSLSGVWERIKGDFSNFLQNAGEHLDELAVADIKVKIRSGISVDNWKQRGDVVFSALASGNRPVVLALDELPILVNRLLRDDGYHITHEGKQQEDMFMSWLRRTGQSHPGQVTITLSGSVGLEPLLAQAGLSAQANIFSSYDLKPWSKETSPACLAELAHSYDIDLSSEVREHICQRLRCCIPHHVQMFFDKLYDHLRQSGRMDATLEDAEQVYLLDLLSVRGQMDMQHYEGRLETVLGRTGYPVALEILTGTAVKGRLDGDTVNSYRKHFTSSIKEAPPSFGDVLYVLEHDGYLERRDGSYRFVSGLLEDWWRSRYGENFEPVIGTG